MPPVISGFRRVRKRGTNSPHTINSDGYPEKIVGLVIELPCLSTLSPALASSLCFRLRALLAPVNAYLNVVSGDGKSFMTFIANSAKSERNSGLPYALCNQIIEQSLRDGLMEVIETLMTEADWLAAQGVSDQDILDQLCPWYAELRSATEAAADLDDVSWLGWTSLSQIEANHRKRRFERKAKAETPGHGKSRKADKRAKAQKERLEHCREQARAVAQEVAARQAERAECAERETEHVERETARETGRETARAETPAESATT